MKKQFLMITLVLVLLFIFVGCSSEKPSSNAEATNSQQNSEQENETEKLIVEDKSSEQPVEASEDKEIKDEKEIVENGTPVEEDTPIIGTSIDSSLEGIELLQSISGDRPKKLKMKMDMVAMGMTTSSTVYYDGDDSRTETAIEGMGTSVQIYNEEEKAMYTYLEDATNGTRVTGIDVESFQETSSMIDLDMEFIKLKEEAPAGFIARVEKLDSEEVVYLEATVTDEEMGEVLVKMWYSTKYNTPLQYQIAMGEQQLMSLKVVEIDKNVNIDKKLFQAPAGITFQDVDLDYFNEMMSE